jgi:glycine cleavage system H lipoate-binding protein
MTCPFLREARVKFCRTAAVRKMIPLTLAAKTGEKCGGAEHASCAVFREQPAEDADCSGACPYLRESLMQYCGAAPVAKFVPYSESLISRCGNDGYRYCELYLGMAHPAMGEPVDGVALPDWLHYSANHMWLDVTEDGVCHAGIDAFLSRALGKVDRISYVWQKGVRRPSAVLTVNGMDLEVVFPNAFLLTGCNLYLRADPARLAAEPYTGGWMFEGTPLPNTTEGLLEGPTARDWMEREQHRMNEFLQQQCGFSADGGQIAGGLLRGLDREHALALYHEFFHL